MGLHHNKSAELHISDPFPSVAEQTSDILLPSAGQYHFQFDNNLSDVHRLNPCHSRFIRPQHTLAKPASQRSAELMASLFAYLIIFMFYIHINQVEERWIMKSSSLLQNTLIQTCIIIMYHLSDYRQVRILGL